MVGVATHPTMHGMPEGRAVCDRRVCRMVGGWRVAGLTSREPPGTSRKPLGQSIPNLSDPIGSLSVTSGWVACDIVGLKWAYRGKIVGRLWEGRLA